ncbi:MAG: hypothetical protein K0Q72_2014 [Armatimonadetes bacterium]|jgi:hypothetical protein|nr:hypothetical protein [Armatimonadota bacterium]
MMPTEIVPTTYEEAVRLLSTWHAELDRADLQIFSFPDPEARVVRLLEVSSDFAESDQLRPLSFGASKEFPFRSSVALATPAEWQEVLAGKRSLPAEWSLAERRLVWPDGKA